jgi:hypothetical protein
VVHHPHRGLVADPGSSRCQLAHPSTWSLSCGDVEDGPSGNRYATFVNLTDANNRLYGHANYVRVEANVGVESAPLTVVVGGSSIILSDLTTTGAIGAAGLRPTGRASSDALESALNPDAASASHGRMRDEARKVRKRRQGQTRCPSPSAVPIKALQAGAA